MQLAQLIESAQYVTDNRGQQTAIMFNLDLWQKFIDVWQRTPSLSQPTEMESTDEDAAIEREAQAFRRLHSSLLERYNGRYVAIYHEELVDYDDDQVALYLRIDEKYPDEFVMITPVNEEVEEVFHFRSPRIAL
ncbi:MAG: DUF5678 domain-containing protein [Chloroflexota bacterium]